MAPPRWAKSAACAQQLLEEATYRPLLHYDVKYIKRVHSDAHCKAVWRGELAFPSGCGSFVDAFHDDNAKNDVRVKQGTLLQVVDEDTGLELYSIEGKATQTEGTIKVEEERKHVRNIVDVVSSSMTKKRGKKISGMGIVWAAGNRYRYSEPKNSDRQKLASVAVKKGVDPNKYYSALQHIQACTAATQRVNANWSPHEKHQVQKQGRLMAKVCTISGTAGHTHPIVSGSENGAFGAHWEPRDVKRTHWLSLGYGALVFPTHEHTAYLEPGDVIRFDARTWFHANMIKPTVDDIADRLRREQVHPVHGRTAQQMHANAHWMDQSIMAMYYQSQQQSYMVNKFNKENPDNPHNPRLDENGQWLEAPPYAPSEASDSEDSDDPHLCPYEIERHIRIKRNEAEATQMLKEMRAARAQLEGPAM